MKTNLIALVTLFFSLQVMSQDEFFVKIHGGPNITCGDSSTFEAKLVSPVNISVTLFEGMQSDFFEYQIVDSESNIIEHSSVNINLTFDTTLYLEKGDYVFKWLNGCAMCNNPNIEGKISNWRVVESYVECDFNVSALVNTEDVSYTWHPIESNSNKIYIAPSISSYFKLVAEHTSGSQAVDSVLVLVEPLTIDAGQDKSIICGGNVQFDSLNTNYTGTGALAYSWSPVEGLSSSDIAQPIVNISTNKTYTLLVSTSNGCTAQDSVRVSITSLPEPKICMVTVDSSNHNMIVWEQLTDNPYDSIIIYKETSQSDVYDKIGSHSSSNVSVFIDENSNPAQNSSRYKISVLDTCGYETAQSDFHKTIHLTINSGINGAWNLIWDGYEGFSYGTYNIYRGTSDGNMLKIAEQASNTFTYTDLTPPVETVYYQIEVENPNSCNISNLKSSNNYYGSTRSNLVNSNQVNSVDDFSFEGVKIYPNPVNDKVYIKTIACNDFDMEILSLDGKLMFKYQNVQNNSGYDISALKPGMYLIKLTNYKKSMTMKLIKR